MSDQEKCARCSTPQPSEHCTVCKMLQCIDRGDKDGFLAILQLEHEQNPISEEELSLWRGLKRPEKKLEVDEESDSRMLAAWKANNSN